MSDHHRLDAPRSSTTAAPKVVSEAPFLLDVRRVAAPVREQVLDQLRDAIIGRRLPPGRRLIERELVEMTGVSRATIREVLRELAAAGLVESAPKRGTVVASVSLERAAELYEVRALLESMVVRQFADRADAGQRLALRRAMDGIEATLGDADMGQRMLVAKKAFYDALFEGAGNLTVAEIVEGLQARVMVLRATSLAQPGRPMETVEEIRAIVAALEAGDGETAAQACAFHIRQAARTVLGEARVGMTRQADEDGGS